MEKGWRHLTQQLEEELKAQGHKPYVIPVGGSNALGTWGYMECINELLQQVDTFGLFTDMFVVNALSA